MAFTISFKGVIFLFIFFICTVHIFMLFNTSSYEAPLQSFEENISNIDLIGLNASLTGLRNEIKQRISSVSYYKEDVSEKITDTVSFEPQSPHEFREQSEIILKDTNRHSDVNTDNYVVHKIDRIPIPSNTNINSNINTHNLVDTTLAIPQTRVHRRNVRVAIFTMDSFTAYEEESKKGGAAGELLVRYSLQHALNRLGATVTVIRSDSEFNKLNNALYDYILVDPWTWAGPGWIAKPVLRGQHAKVFVLDFFGYQRLKGTSLQLPDDRYLTAFGGSPKNTFLGYFLPPLNASSISKWTHEKQLQGVIWGKDPKHFNGESRKQMLRSIADRVPLIATTTKKLFDHPNIRWAGHQSRENWHQLLLESKFVIGLGDPLLGPSAIDAISSGCTYINPIYKTPVRGVFTSQHPYARENIGSPRVCSVLLTDIPSVMSCVEGALKAELEPYNVPDFTEEAHLSRVKKIFNLN